MSLETMTTGEYFAWNESESRIFV